jgi:LuxR family quorum-sensing system transcriptional regulator CciR
MPADRRKSRLAASVVLADSFIRTARAATSPSDIATLMEAVTAEMGFRYYALIHHADLRGSPPGRIDIRDYPEAIVARIISERRYRRDPVIRACAFADGAFLWSELGRIIALDRHDWRSLDAGRTEGLNEGITVPCSLLGECMGSCTFAGLKRPELACRWLGPAQMIGIFAFQAARRLIGGGRRLAPGPRLHPKPRDCVVLAGRGKSNKEIARALGLTPRTVDGYLTEARELFDAHSRAQLVASALYAGEIELHELAQNQPE